MVQTANAAVLQVKAPAPVHSPQPAAPPAKPAPAAASPAPQPAASPAKPAPVAASPAPQPAAPPAKPGSAAASPAPQPVASPAKPAPVAASPAPQPAAPPAKPAPVAASPALSSPTLSTPTRPGPGRRTPPRLRAFFLRHFRACGAVKPAAERTGVAVSTVYRWRDRDASFRARWDSLAEQRRQLVEDRLMGFALEGEKTAVFHKGEQVGWRQSHTARAAIAALAYFDRREKAALAAAARDAAAHDEDDDDGDWDDDGQPEVEGWAARAERVREAKAHEERMRASALASRSEAPTEAKERVGSDSSPAEGPRKIGNGPALPAFDRDRVPVAARAPATSPPTPPPRAPQPPRMPVQSRLPDGRPANGAAASRREAEALLALHYPHRLKPEMLIDNWKPYATDY